MESTRCLPTLRPIPLVAAIHLTDTSISLSTFRNLPIEVQREYARFHKVRNAERLTTDEICDSLFNGTEWLQDPDSTVVNGDVMDLVDWHIEHHAHARSPNRLPSPDDTLVEPPLNPSVVAMTSDARLNRHHNTDIQLHHLQRMSEDLQRANTRIKAAIQESRKAARDVCAEVFLLQHELDTEKAYQPSVSCTMADIFGAEAMDEIEQQVGTAENACRLDGTGKKRRRSSTSYHVVILDASRRAKRCRLDDSKTQESTAPRTILNYHSDDDELDDTYSDSNGTERDFVDDPYSYFDSRGRTPCEALESWNWTRESSDGESSDGETDPYIPNPYQNIPWASIEDFDKDSSDPDYEPPDWDLEDIWEIDHPRQESLSRRRNPLFLDNFGDELNDCHGFLSDAGLSTDDPEAGYHDIAIVQRPSKGTFVYRRDDFPPSLGPLLEYVNYDPSFIGASELDDEDREAIKQSKIQQEKLTRWYNIKVQLQYNLFGPLDLEQRLADLVESHHRHFYFDDVEWRRFEDH